jgi:hypothetical protein
MPEKKNQHYVPQFHLKNFSVNGDKKTIGLFNIASNKFIENKAKIQHQSSEDYFYGKDLVFENALEGIETVTSGNLKKIIDTNYFPSRFSEKHHALISFVCLLWARTKYVEDRANEKVDKFTKQAFSQTFSNEELDLVRVRMDKAIQSVLSSAAKGSELLYDLNYRVLFNKTNIPFWTSDNPVVFYNQLLESLRPYANNIGFASKGLQIIYPFSPKHCLLFYDGNTYGFGSDIKKIIEVVNESDVERINLTQYINANENLYFNENFTDTYVKDFAKKFEGFRRLEKVFTKGFPNPEDPLKSYILQYEIEVRCNLKLSFIRLLMKTINQLSEIKENREIVIPRSSEIARLLDKLEETKEEKL